MMGGDEYPAFGATLAAGLMKTYAFLSACSYNSATKTMPNVDYLTSGIANSSHRFDVMMMILDYAKNGTGGEKIIDEYIKGGQE